MKKFMIISGAILILIGVVIFSYSLYFDFKYSEEDESQLQYYFENFYEEKEVEDQVITQLNEKSNSDDKKSSNYLAVLEIPIINLKTGVIMSNNTFSSMERNVSIYPNSNMPNEENGNFILFGHSGNSRVGYFNKIDELNETDCIKVYYQNKIYKYKVIEKLEVSKSNHYPLRRNFEESRITLITCLKNDNDKRLIVVGELVNAN